MLPTEGMIPLNLNGKIDRANSMPLSPQSSSSKRRRRQSWRQRRSMLLFLAIMTILSFSLNLVKSDNCHGENCKENDQDEEYELIGEEKTVETRWEQDSTITETTTKVNIQIMPKTHNLPKLLLSPRANESRNRIWIVLAYRETSELSMKLLRKMRYQAIPRIEFNSANLGDNGDLRRPEMKFVPMPIDDIEIGIELKEKILNRLGVVRLPSLFFLWDEEQEPHVDNTLHLENIFATAEVYRGRSETVSDLVNGLYHYLSRLQLRTASPPKQFNDRGLPLAAIRVGSLRDLQNIMRNSGEIKVLQNPPLALAPYLSDDDDVWVRYLMDDDSGETNSIPYRDLHHGDMDDMNNNNEKDGAGTCPQHQSTAGDPYHAVVQCRNNMREGIVGESHNRVKSTDYQAQQSYDEYDQAIKALGSRRDVLFSILEPDIENQNSSHLSPFCSVPSDDGLVKVFNFRSMETLVEVGHGDKNEEVVFEEYLNNSAGILDQLSSRLRPALLWFDRRMTAPIAFHPRYRRHAILFVDFHDRSSASKTRDVIRLFRQECWRRRREQQSNMNHFNSALNQSAVEMVDGDSGENSFMCLIVPSTEIRVLNTFGIDIWSNLDRQATEKIRNTLCQSHSREGQTALDDLCCDNYEGQKQSKHSESVDTKFSSVLPTLLVTDQQKDGTIQRYYLDPPITSQSLRKFVHDFVHGRTEPEKKSSHIKADNHDAKDGEHNFPTNQHFINLLTAESLPLFLRANREKHVLVELYAPTCGHCKRFNIIWNALGKLIKFLGWSDQLLLARIDVTSNEVNVPGMVANWLPDLFYFGVGVSENPVHYGKTPFADEVELGSISDPLDLLEWWMDVAGDAVNEVELLHLLDKMTTDSAA